jgi:Kef-type K+ transport system membrane component KefB
MERALSVEGGILSGVGYFEDPLWIFLVQATIIISICGVLGLLGRFMKQPKVIFEIIGGIILGPSAMGRNEKYLQKIFPLSSLDYLGIVANIGLVLYLFLVGLELDPALLVSHAKKAGGIALLGMAVPFALGVAISGTMFDILEKDDPLFADVSHVSFFVFIGTALSITAFPVLARLLKEGGLIYTPAGAMAMGAAALNDALAWCLLTLAISIANAGDLTVAGKVFGCVAAVAIGLFVLIAPIFARFVEYVERMDSRGMDDNLFALTLCLMFMCAWTTGIKTKTIHFERSASLVSP